MFSIYNMKTGRRLNKDMELHFLEVPKFKKKPVKDMTSIERWLAYFSNKLDEKEMEELAMTEAAIQTALDATSIFMQDSSERLAYLNREMAILDYESDKAAWTAEGEARGEAKGEDRLSRLITHLLSIGQGDKIATVASDPKVRHALYEKYGIS